MTSKTFSKNIDSYIASACPRNLILGLSALAVLSSLLGQYVFGLDPCPLCLTQRLLFMAIFFVAALWRMGPVSGYAHKMLALLSMSLAVTGVAIVGYHYSLLTGLIDSGCNITFPMFIGRVQDKLPEQLLFLLDGTGSCSPALWSAEFFQTYLLIGCALCLFLAIGLSGLKALAGHSSAPPSQADSR